MRKPKHAQSPKHIDEQFWKRIIEMEDEIMIQTYDFIDSMNGGNSGIKARLDIMIRKLNEKQSPVT